MRLDLAQRQYPTRSGRRVGLSQVAVLLKIYAKCTNGQDHIVRRRIEDALAPGRGSGRARRPNLVGTAET